MRTPEEVNHLLGLWTYGVFLFVSGEHLNAQSMQDDPEVMARTRIERIAIYQGWLFALYHL
jgi:hypothetical protein